MKKIPVFLIALLLICNFVEASTKVMKFPSGTPVEVTTPSDLEELGGGHDAVTLSAAAEAVFSLSSQEVGLDTQPAHYAFIGPGSGDPAAPTFRALVSGDIPDLSDIYAAATHNHDTAYVAKNADITAGTKTKITYDAKGLVTSGADATTADIPDSTDKRYVTEAEKTVLGNTSGTNTGDQDLSGLVPYTGAAANVDIGSYTFSAGPGVYVNNNLTSGNPTLRINQQGAASRSKYLDFTYQGTVRARIMSDGQTNGNMTFKVHNGSALVTALVFDTSGAANFQANSITTTGAISGSNVSGTNTGDETQATIKTKLGAAATGADGYLMSTDWNTFNGKQAGHANLTSLAALSFVSTSFVKMTAAGTFGLDTNIYMTADEKVKNVSSDASAGYLAEKLAALYPGLYQRDQKWALKTPYTTAANRYTILTPNKLSVDINGTVYFLTAQAEIDLSSSANWDTTSPTDYTTAANRAGKDFYIYACVPVSGSSPKIVLSANSTTPSGYTNSNSRKIGGFHGLCVAVGTISGHTLTDFVAGDVLPASIWDLLHRPVSNPEGMVYCEAINKWVDIYLASGTGSSTASVYGGTISDIRDWNDFVDDGAAVKKRMLDDGEFQVMAAGSNEQTNIYGTSDPGTTGGHSDTESRRMISNIGVEDCCGVMWQWLSDQSSTYDSEATEGWTGADSGKGYLYYLDYTRDIKLVAGGYWNYGWSAGSRSRSADCSRWSTYSTIGCRFCAEPV